MRLGYSVKQLQSLQEINRSERNIGQILSSEIHLESIIYGWWLLVSEAGKSCWDASGRLSSKVGFHQKKEFR